MLEETLNKIVLVSSIVPIGLVALLVWFFLSYQKRKFIHQTEMNEILLREQALIIEKHTLLEIERTRIASEMHDDLGSGLTTIRYLSDDILNRNVSEEIKDNIIKIANNATTLVQNMSEIIWAMNSRFDSAEGLISYIRRYVVEYLDDQKMDFDFCVNEYDEELYISGEDRRNILLIVKEILHNSVKYSGAKAMHIKYTFNQNLVVEIGEIGGKGFDPKTINGHGNGIFNMKKRIKNSGGTLEILNTDNGMLFIINMPIKEVLQTSQNS